MRNPAPVSRVPKDRRSYCPWCNKQVYGGEPSIVCDGDIYHLQCAAEDEENAFFDRDMEFGDR